MEYKDFIIIKEDVIKYFKNKKTITKDELKNYYKKRKIFTEKIITFLSL